MSVGEREGRRNRGFTESKKKTQINKEVENKAMTKVYGVGRFEVLEGLQKSGVKNPTQWDVSAVNSYCFGYILIPTPEPRTIQIYHIPSICLPCHLFNSFNEVDKQTAPSIPQSLYLYLMDAISPGGCVCTVIIK